VAALVVSSVLLVRRTARAAWWEGRTYIALGAVVLALEAAHAVAPAWWLDTSLDVLVFALAGAGLGQVLRAGAAFRAFDDQPVERGNLRAGGVRF
jgi:hypothetical protein